MKRIRRRTVHEEKRSRSEEQKMVEEEKELIKKMEKNTKNKAMEKQR
jgi:hypothetical protein